jgi:hypothetical protein
MTGISQIGAAFEQGSQKKVRLRGNGIQIFFLRCLGEFMISQTNNVIWHNAIVTPKHREILSGHRSAILWFTDLSGAGKSTLAHAV